MRKAVNELGRVVEVDEADRTKEKRQWLCAFSERMKLLQLCSSPLRRRNTNTAALIRKSVLLSST